MSTAIESPTKTGQPPRTYSRWASLAVLCAGTLMTILDGNIVTVAMPAIQRDLGFSAPGLAWVVNAYLIAFGGLLLLAGRLGDLVGRKRMFTAGLVVFTAASVLCGLATGQGVLIAARALQGVGGALLVPGSLAIIAATFHPDDRARAVGGQLAPQLCRRRVNSKDPIGEARFQRIGPGAEPGGHLRIGSASGLDALAQLAERQDADEQPRRIGLRQEG